MGGNFLVPLSGGYFGRNQGGTAGITLVPEQVLACSGTDLYFEQDNQLFKEEY